MAFTDDGGLVLLRARSEGPHVAIEVDDDGPGIAPADRDRIWERFARGGVARQPGTGGSGLGLPAVKAIVEAHGGSLACRARPGGGTRFTVLLPGAPVAARGAEDTTPALVTAAVG